MRRLRVDKKQILCVILGISFCIAGKYVDNRDGALKDGYLLARNSYGQGDATQDLEVEGVLDENLPVVLTIQERQYREEEIAALFPQICESLAVKILGENESFAQVRRDLNLVTSLPEYGVTIRWESEDSSLIEPSGKVHGERCPGEGTGCGLTAILKAGDYKDIYELNIKVFPPILTPEEELKKAFEELLLSMDEEQKTQEYLTLPEQYEGKLLKYHVRESSDSWLLLALGILAAALLPLRERQKETEEKKKRERQMLLDYSEIVSKLTVFIGAGLPVRKAWERIVLDYEEKETDAGGPRYAYEEMKNVYYKMGRGLPEMRAYAEFGGRCGLLPYRKLAGLLEQNVKNGAEHLRPILESEMESAFEQRKTLARRMGEEAGTKLLLPLFLMLGIVMVMISVPAFLSFGG